MDTTGMAQVKPNYTRPWMYPEQERAMFNDARYSVIEASSKSGKTVSALVWLTEQALHGKAGQNFWWVAPIFPQAKMAFRRMKRALPPWLYEANESELTITLKHGPIVWFKGGDKPDSLYGEDVYAAVIDESSRVKEDSFYAVRSTLTATRGPIRIIGNVKGRKNWAYHMARRAESGEPNMAYHKLTAYDAIRAGVLDQEEVEDARRNLPEHVFRELYLAEPSDDGSNPFGIDAIRDCTAQMSTSAPFVWGIDLAKSVDYTAAIALDVNGVVCRLLHFQAPWQETIERLKEAVGEGKALVDSTGVGDPVVENLQRSGYGRYEGFKFTSVSRQQLLEGLAVAIQQRSIRFPDGVITNELEAFEFESTRTGVRYASSEGIHDDCVMALALATEQLRRRPVEFTGDDLAISAADYTPDFSDELSIAWKW